MSADVFTLGEEPIRVLCLFRLGRAYKLGGLGSPPPGQDWKLVAKFTLGLPGRLTEDGSLFVDKGPHGQRISPAGVALVGPNGWFGLHPMGPAQETKTPRR